MKPAKTPKPPKPVLAQVAEAFYGRPHFSIEVNAPAELVWTGRDDSGWYEEGWILASARQFKRDIEERFGAKVAVRLSGCDEWASVHVTPADLA